MQPSALSDRLDRELRDFAWDEWSQMGILGTVGRRSYWAQDPEALLVFTLEIARGDPRLFDELLDWLVVNESLVNRHRLTAICDGPEDRRLVAATTRWLGTHLPGGAKRTGSTAPADGREPLFRGLSTEVADPDPDFAAAGLLRPVIAPSGKALRPSMREPINFAFRLRQLVGVNARAEVVRYLLTASPAASDMAAIVRSAGFARRNVRQAVASLQDAGVVSQRGKRVFAVDRDDWTRLLRIEADELAAYQAWPQLLGGLRATVRWLRRPGLDELSEYMLGSEARDLLEDVRDRFEEAGFAVGRAPAAGAWGDLEALIDEVLALLRSGGVPEGRISF